VDALGLFDLFEEIFDFITDFFDGDDGNRRRVTRKGPAPAGATAMSTTASPSQQAYWEKTANLITPEFLESLARETGWSSLKVGMKIQGPCSEVLQRWQRVGRPITDIDLKTMRQEIREKILSA
jgi:hypothetical protein